MLNLIKTNDKQFTFTDGRYYEAPSGEWVPSVTTILEAFPKPYQLIQWMKEQGDNADKVRDAAGKRGSTVHQLTEDYDNGLECNLLDDNGFPKYSLEEWGMFERYVEFSNRFNPTNEMVEVNVIDENLGFAGTIDRICTIDGKRYLVDIKTSNALYDTYWLQLSAYAELIRTNFDFGIDGVAILWLNAKTRTDGKKGDMQGKGWQMVVKPFDDIFADWLVFQAVHTVWKTVNKDAKPRLLTYNISHQKS